MAGVAAVVNSLTFAPTGFRLIPDAFSPPASAKYERALGALPLEYISMRGRTLRRRLAAFGLTFGTNFQGVAPAPELPPFLVELLESASRAAGVSHLKFNQALVQLYPPGASIGWHRDAEVFGPTIIGVSFGGAARMRFRTLDRQRSDAILIPPSSVYVICGASRTEWEHSIPATTASRLSVTFRTFR